MADTKFQSGGKRRFGIGKAETMELTRRGFLISAGLAGAAFGFPRSGLAAMDPATADGLPVQAAGARFDPTIWYWIDEAGKVNVHIKQAEMGQHVGTAIARILADELGANWADVSIEHVDTDAKWGFMMTGGSWSVSQSWPLYRQAGAAGRVALADKAAELWGVDASTVTITNGVATSGDNTATFGELVAAGITRTFTADELTALPLRPLSELTLVGKDVEALDIATKVNGQAIYGIDAKIDGMVYGAPLMPPTRYGAEITAIDDTEAKAVRGYQQTLKLDDPSGIAPGFAVVIADTMWAAKKAAKLVKVTWTPGFGADLGEDDFQAENARLIADPASGGVLDTGNSDVDPVFASAANVFEQTYSTATVLHFQMEPLNALAFRNDDGIWEVHTGNQAQSLTVPWLQAALGVGDGQVIMRSYMLGGGFGRRLSGDYAIPAALASQQLDGRPVKLVFSREDDVAFDGPRAPSMSQLRMAFDADNKVVAMDSAYAAGWPTKANMPAGLATGTNGEPYDPFAVDGGDHWYETGAQRLRAISNDLAVQTFRPGWLRSVGPGWTNFSLESFMDEAAHHIGADPLQFRLDHLTAEGRNAGGNSPLDVGGATRQANVLRRVAEISDYANASLPEGSALGLATTFGQSRGMPTWVAAVVQIAVDKEWGEIKVEKIWMVVDCGVVVDPDGARAQLEGGALWGVSMALYEGTGFENGMVRDRNLASYTPLRLIDTPPEVHIELVESTEAPVGLGEPGVTVIAPAIANALFNATGVRMRHLPMTADDVVAAIEAEA
ncbi:xanthine dehydrogenase family protein molybdopterin-binding subunit [Ketogulonicigenium vulgare]|uniref:xanthine dehydrogenase family protein molybdopterin-binding subunit n=1 Tax=Ketogulonicigenium vulgare TaxID=92945 RepID=UPI0008AA5EEC|nr:molybdopterin cofactor-binding domain-containing protein [Ketogulonicigenium vulgare]AOZ53089.1 Twin-arginine translocation pathway signal [Ketogulonicigenium vulgare]